MESSVYLVEWSTHQGERIEVCADADSALALETRINNAWGIEVNISRAPLRTSQTINACEV